MTSQSTRTRIQHSRPTLGDEEEQAVQEVLRSGQLAGGKRVAAFEEAMAEKVGCKYACGVSSGLAALHLALLALGVGTSDEVILPSLTCEALLDAVLYCEATPVIVDVDAETGNIEPSMVRGAITDRTRLVIVPHMFGTPVAAEEIVALGRPVLEDCAQALGADVGRAGVVSIFSFYATKMICTGEGGMVLSDNGGLIERIRDLRNYRGHASFRPRYGYQMTDIAAALGIEQLKRLGSFVARRRAIAGLYSTLLPDVPCVTVPDPTRHAESVFYRYVIKVPAREWDIIRETMLCYGVECGLGVLHALHRIVSGTRPCPVTDSFVQRMLSLPIYPLLFDKEVERVVKTLRSVMLEVGPVSHRGDVA